MEKTNRERVEEILAKVRTETTELNVEEYYTKLHDRLRKNINEIEFDTDFKLYEKYMKLAYDHIWETRKELEELKSFVYHYHNLNERDQKYMLECLSELYKNISNKKITNSTEITVSTVESIRYAGTHEYQGEEIDCYLVKLEEYDSFFYLYGKYNNFPKVGMNISHKFNGEKIVEWKKLK